MANFLIVGDAPNAHSGLARIAKDISQHLVGDGHNVDFLGLGWQWGWDETLDFGYPVWPVRDGAEFGQRDVLEHVYRLTTQYKKDAVGDNVRVLHPADDLIVFFIWDPSRCASAIAALRHEQKKGRFGNVKIWGYYAVDAEGPAPGGGFTGPAAMAVQETDRILAYTEFGARVLLHSQPREALRIDHLPHGLRAPFVPPLFKADPPDELYAVDDKNVRSWARIHYGRILGAVATNQPRKDIPLLLEAGARAREAGLIDALWLHTDILFGNFSLPLFTEAFGWIGGKNLLITTPNQRDPQGLTSRWKIDTDEELAAMYQACRVTFAPGLGEGWGYPIVESLALGVPCVGVDYAGGGEILPLPFRAAVGSWRWDGSYCLKRPVMHPGEVLARLTSACRNGERPEARETIRAYGQKWAWTKIWPELWRPWVEAGVR